jgi:NAD(P)-dependent dehydrogenase (short-subunit alcohol dehydrogenase family)
MNAEELSRLYDFRNKAAVVTGGAGVLCGEIACCLAELGARVAILDLAPERVDPWRPRLDGAESEYRVLPCDVLRPDSIEAAAAEVRGAFGSVDILINGAGGNHPKATTSEQIPFFDIPPEAMRFVFELNLLGTILPSQAFGRVMAEQGEGIILNISSMNAFRPLTRIAAYSAAKAGVSNFTQWLAVHMATQYSPRIRVNAVAPGFFLTEQNRFLLTDEKTGALTPRGQAILSHTPAGRFGHPRDLLGAVLFLLSPAAEFVTGVVLPIDGGYQAFGGI